MQVVFIGPFGLQPKATMSTRALRLAKALVRRGHRVTMLIPPWDDPARAGQAWHEAGVDIVNVALPARIPLLFHILLTHTLAAQALALHPDVIHFFKPKAYAGLAHLVLWWLRRLGGRGPRLVVDEDDWEQAWNDVSPYSALQKKLFAWQESWGLRHADAVTVASRALEKLAAAKRGDRGENIFYVPNGYLPDSENSYKKEVVLADQAVREQWSLGAAPVALLYTRFVEFRWQRIVSLVRQVSQSLPEARWLIIGRGFAGEEQSLAAALAGEGLTPYVRFTGWLPFEQLPAYFQAANVAIFPYDDTPINRTKCSVKLIDLLLAGLPVVADAVGQNCEYIQPNVSGRLVPAEDDIAFAEAIVRLLRAPEQQRSFGLAAARHLRQNFNWDQLSQFVERIYH